MKRLLCATCVLLLAGISAASATDASRNVDVRRGVPDDVFLAVYGKHNPERDYQRRYYDEVWQTVQKTKIMDKVVQMVTAQMSSEDYDKAKGVVDELREATKGIDIKALADAQEIVYAQWMQMAPMPTSQHLLILRVTPEAAASTAEGVKNLLALAERYSGGEVTVSQREEAGAQVYGLVLPPQVPFQPAVAHMGDLFLFCSSRDLLSDSLQLLAGGSGACKFDDPRLKAALRQLPEMEDSLVFYDGRAQFAALRRLGGFLQQVGRGDSNVELVTRILDKLWDDVAIIDFEVTVEYTEGNLNRSATYGKLLPGTEDATLRKMLSGGQAFEKWYAWVPAGALSYSVCKGVNLHLLYERILAVLQEDVPAAAPALEQFEAIQAQLDLHLDRDILQAFPGEHVSVTLPAAKGKRPESVVALRCTKPDRIKELLHRAMAAVQQIKEPIVQAQQPKFVESEELEGFEALSLAVLNAFQVRPVFGFQDGWLYIGSSADAVKKVLATKAGRGETVEGTEAFRKLRLDVDGPVDSIAYKNTAEQVHAVADMLDQLGITIPMVMAMVPTGASQDDLKPFQAILSLLPDVSKIVRKFDFLEANVTVVQPGSDPGSYEKRSVTVVRPADAASAE